ncbi:hypothetical protein QJS10_CPB13g01246 [Acorus calamus]|uniref:Uncharacterized protein n=1 Tax=Acorus calamus TaxID=4465 RepID=A0AAV9DJ59_ACOCL|nr:hypothetical protein QJS10_CPB13g01246 [Acorus calamus]
MLGINVDVSRLEFLAGLFHCEVQKFPSRILGLPLHLGRLTKADWVPLIERFEKRLEGWSGIFLSLGGRLVLLQAILSNLPIFFLSLFKLLLGVRNRLEVIRRRFLWNGAKEVQNRVHLVKWDIVCSSKKSGGVGILNICDMNTALLMKWLWRWLFHPNLQWCRIVKERYECDDSLRHIFPRDSLGLSGIWKGIMDGLGLFQQAVMWSLGSVARDGVASKFWSP